MVSSIHQKNKISFSADIKFSTLKKIERNLEKGINVSKWDLVANPSIQYSVDEAIHGNKLGTAGILMCNGGGITGGNTDKNLVFHLFGDFFMRDLAVNFKKLDKKFEETVALLKKENKKPQVLIFGGQERDFESKDLMVILKYLIEKFKLNHTVFWGTKIINSSDHGEKNIFYKGKIDTWFVNLNNLGTNFLKKKKVLDSFNYVRVSPNDRVKFSDTDWISGKDGSLNKGQLDLTIHDVLKKYRVSHKILDELQVKL